MAKPVEFTLDDDPSPHVFVLGGVALVTMFKMRGTGDEEYRTFFDRMVALAIDEADSNDDRSAISALRSCRAIVKRTFLDTSLRETVDDHQIGFQAERVAQEIARLEAMLSAKGKV